MKRLVTLICVLLLLPACALGGSYTASFGGQPLFTFSCDSSRYRMDSESYLAGNSAERCWFFMLYDGSSTIECGLDSYAELKGLGSGNTAQLGNFLCSAYGGTLLETCSINGQSYVVISRSNSLMAAALMHGYVVYFEIFDMLSGRIGSDALTTLKDALSCCTPL